MRALLLSMALPALFSMAASATAAQKDEKLHGESVDGAPIPSRPTVQPRFASKAGRPYAHVHLGAHIRNDFYDTFIIGGEAGYFLDENLAFSFRVTRLYSSLSRAAIKIRDETGMTPDARPQDVLIAPGAHLALGYGKALLLGGWLLHFDPMAKGQLGVSKADTRWLPTAVAGLALLGHLQYGIQVRMDLDLSFQLERRARGWVPSIGFMPALVVGWRIDPGVFR